MTDQSSLFVPDNPQQDTGLDLLGRLTAGSFLEGDALAPLRAILHNMLAVYSTAVLVIASFVALYLVLLTIVDAAQTGKLFRKVNPVWGPLRLIMVIGLLVPLGGLNSGQYIVTALAQWGSGLASKTWALATTDIEAIKPLLATPQPPPALALVRALVLRDVCVQYTSRLAAELAAAAERQRKEAEQSGGPSQPPSAPALQTVQAQEVRQNADGSSTIPWGWAERPYYCGAVTHYPADEERDPPAMRILKEGHEEALALLEDRTENYARDYLALLAGEETGAGQQPRRMAEKYEEVLALATGQSFAAAIEAEAETARQKAAAGGWLAAPAYLDTILQLNVRTFSTMASLPQVDPPEILLNPPSYSSGSNNPAAAEYRLYQVLRRINDSWGEAPLVPPLSAAGLGGLSATLSHATALARSVSGPGSTGHKLRSARDLIRTNDFDWDKFGKASPIVGLASLGTYLTGKSVELLAGAGVLNDVGPVTGPSVTLLTTLGLLAFGAS